MEFTRRSLPPLSGDVQWVVGAAIIDDHDRIFLQRRSLDRALFPGCWDLVGGHVDAGEDLATALARETREETGWSVVEVLACTEPLSWMAGDEPRLEVDAIVRVDGDLEQPALEWDKHSEFRWFAREDLPILLEGRSADDPFITDVVTAAFDWIAHDLYRNRPL